jgi:hypothetical protein
MSQGPHAYLFFGAPITDEPNEMNEALWDLANSIGGEFRAVFSGFCDYDRLFVAIDKSVVSTYGSHAEPVILPPTDETKKYIRLLSEFCAAKKIELKKPGWYLVAYYG